MEQITLFFREGIKGNKTRTDGLQNEKLVCRMKSLFTMKGVDKKMRELKRNENKGYSAGCETDV